jgi:transcriptional regulator with XRE-family HTH domain
VVTLPDERGHASVPAPTSHILLPSLRHWRVVALLTQAKLAERASVAVGTVARAEQGYPVSLLTAQRLANTLGVTVHQLREEEPTV